MKINRSIVKRTLALLLLISALALSACAPKAAPTNAAEFIATQVAATIQARSTQDMAETLIARMTLQAMPTNTPIPTPSPTSPPPPTLAPTSAPTVVYIPPAATLTPTPQALCLKAVLVADVTIPDGTKLSPGETFTKTWRFRNAGTCAWDTEFDIVFVSGDQLSAPAILDFPAAVPVGGTIDISIAMTAPSSAGTYTGSWAFTGPGRQVFGIGADGKGYFQVKIVVE
ncbi:MAG TPA: NBR1-Ig-like domain-containing protein [Anaerolineaceae bacterium]|jgi:hypothetical protein|nr:NBR1-Ig-like domain-containing protein [Anaerolineaceae bacterium]